ncbi:hypothetical protein EMEDMD4_1250005 [Sinorhizobium medicae]|uniref:Uncharacterized protein n=1 Tax=Sinorhizobium medicae TaxID=110321 RepID=A0A508WSL8_9HYPH|nr:hypothetical protein EMEDMD4_1250005 [Sinorhizobium medicae]
MLRLSTTGPIRLKLLLALSQARISQGQQSCEVACMRFPFRTCRAWLGRNSAHPNGSPLIRR